VKNLAKELSKDQENGNLLEKLEKVIVQIEETLYTNRFDLEKIHSFIEFHTFKNKCIYFMDLIELKRQQEIMTCFKDIESTFNSLVSKSVAKTHERT